MDDLDSGIGSNDSNGVCSDNTVNLKTVFKSLKTLNGQSLLNPFGKVKEGLESSEGLDGSSPNGLLNVKLTACQLEGNNRNDNASLSDPIHSKRTLPDDCEDASVESVKAIPDCDKVDCDMLGKDDNTMLGVHTAAVAQAASGKALVESEKENDIIVLDDSDTLTPVEQITPKKDVKSVSASSENTPNKSHPFFLGDKVRNSLKDLVAKVQTCSPDKKPATSSEDKGKVEKKDSVPMDLTVSQTEEELIKTEEKDGSESNTSLADIEKADQKEKEVAISRTAEEMDVIELDDDDTPSQDEETIDSKSCDSKLDCDTDKSAGPMVEEKTVSNSDQADVSEPKETTDIPEDSVRLKPAEESQGPGEVGTKDTMDNEVVCIVDDADSQEGPMELDSEVKGDNHQGTGEVGPKDKIDAEVFCIPDDPDSPGIQMELSSEERAADQKQPEQETPSDSKDLQHLGDSDTKSEITSVPKIPADGTQTVNVSDDVKDSKLVAGEQTVKQEQTSDICKVTLTVEKSSDPFPDKSNPDLDKKFDDSGAPFTDAMPKQEVKPTSKESSDKVEVLHDRKRPADSSDSGVSDPKRSRLDLMIGKLGSQIGIKPGSGEVDQLHTDELTEAGTEIISECEEKSDTLSATEVMTVSDDDEEEEEEEDEDDEEEEKDDKTITVTETELDELVKKKVVEYLQSQRDTLISQMRQKIKDLQATNEMWKSEVRELTVKVADVTVLQQKHEKRKAATAALKQITTRSVAIQADESKHRERTRLATLQTPPKADMGAPSRVSNQASSGSTKTVTPQKILIKTSPQVPSSPTNPIIGPMGSNGTIRLPIPQSSLPPPVLTAQAPPVSLMSMPQSSTGLFPRLLPTVTTQTTVTSQSSGQVVTSVPGNPVVKQLLDTTRQQITQASLSTSTTTATGTTPMVLTYPSRLLTQSNGTSYIAIPQSVAPGAGAVPTSIVNKTAATVTTSNVPSASFPATQFVQTVPSSGVKVIDLTGDEDAATKHGRMVQIPGVQGSVNLLQPSSLNPVIPGQTGTAAPHQSILLSSPMGTQIVRTTLANPHSSQTYQLVFNTNSPALRPANMMTSMIPAVVQQTTAPVATATASVATKPPVPSVPAGQVVQLVTASASAPPKPVTVVTQASKPSIPTPTVQVVKPSTTISKETTNPQHPAPFPPLPQSQIGLKYLPPKPSLKISRVSQGIVLSWNMIFENNTKEIASYQLYAYQEGSALPSTSLWKKVGDVKALPLPMACTLTQFQEGHKYHFAVRALDVLNHVGLFSDPSSIDLTPSK